jgi:hypothetical protein
MARISGLPGCLSALFLWLIDKYGTSLFIGIEEGRARQDKGIDEVWLPKQLSVF